MRLAVFPLDIYGAHLNIKLPNNSAFDVTGGELGLFPNASQPWHNQFQIGDVPDSGSTLLLAFVAVVLLFTLDAAMRRMRLGMRPQSPCLLQLPLTGGTSPRCD